MEINLSEAVQDAIYATAALQKPFDQNIQVALHEIDPDVIDLAPDLGQTSRVLTIVDPDRRVTVACAYVEERDAEALIEGILRHLAPSEGVNLDFCQHARISESCRRHLDELGIYWNERGVPRRAWPFDAALPATPEGRFAAQMNGRADGYSVEVARGLVAHTRETGQEQGSRRSSEDMT